MLLTTPLTIDVGGKLFAMRVIKDIRPYHGTLVEVYGDGYVHEYQSHFSAHVNQVYEMKIHQHSAVDWSYDPYLKGPSSFYPEVYTVEAVLNPHEILSGYCKDADYSSSNWMQSTVSFAMKKVFFPNSYAFGGFVPNSPFASSWQGASAGEQAAEAMAELIPDIKDPNKKIQCPEHEMCVRTGTGRHPLKATMFDLIMHLNDVEKWSREKIATWVEDTAAEHEINIVLPTPENPPPEPGEEKMKESMKGSSE